MSRFAELYPFFSRSLRRVLQSVRDADALRAEEIRVRVGRPLMLSLNDGDAFLGPTGRLHRTLSAAPYVVTADDVGTTVQLMTDHSMYAVDEQLRHGYLTLPGGYRVGLAGETVVQLGAVKRLKHVASLNVRVARAVPGAADRLIGRLRHELASTTVPNVLLVSPPGAGKTTLLRDLARQVSAGAPAFRIPGRKVVIVDERSELAACRAGVPQYDVGPRTDVLDACPKPEGMRIALRSLAPDVLVTDEIGEDDDVTALVEARGAGVAVFATAHARSLTELWERPVMERLLTVRVFDCLALLSRRDGPGTIEQLSHRRGQVLSRAGAS